MYVDGFVLVMPKKNLPAYKKMAKQGGSIWMKCGATGYVEAIGDDLAVAKKWGNLPFDTMVNAKKGEIVVFSYVTYKSRKHRDAVNKKVHAEMDKLYADAKDFEMPFDVKRCAVGGFEAFVDL